MTAQKLMPYQLAALDVKTSDRRRPVQVMSYPTPDQTIFLRMVPGEPTTGIEIPIGGLCPIPPLRYVHVARVHTHAVFPYQALGNQNAFLYDHTLPERGKDKKGLKNRSYYNHDEDDPFLIYAVSDDAAPPWVPELWFKAGCALKSVGTHDLENPGSGLLNTVQPARPSDPPRAGREWL